MFERVPDPSDLSSVPPAQSQYDGNEESHTAWVKRVSHGIKIILQSERPASFSRRPQAVGDLNKCLGLLRNREPTPFAWSNVDTLYMSYAVATDRRPAALLPNVTLEHVEDDDDEEGEEVYAYDERPRWQLSDICIMATEAPPFWAMVR